MLHNFNLQIIPHEITCHYIMKIDIIKQIIFIFSLQQVAQQSIASVAPMEASSSANFQRSKSLGGYYKGRDLPQAPPPPPPPHNSGYPEGSYQVQMMQPAMQHHMAPGIFQHPGSMTPVSFARWQHDVVNGSYGGNMGANNEFPNNRRHNPLYDTPPVARRPNPSHLLGK